jgi:hypothetical protein
LAWHLNRIMRKAGCASLSRPTGSPLLLVEIEEKNRRAAGASREAIRQFLAGYGYRAAHLRKGRWYATDDLAGVRGRNIFWYNPEVEAHRRAAARLPVLGIHL